MITCWGLLAFVKAADTRQNASFAIRLDRKSDFRDDVYDDEGRNPEDLFEEVAAADDFRIFEELSNDMNIESGGKKDTIYRPTSKAKKEKTAKKPESAPRVEKPKPKTEQPKPTPKTKPAPRVEKPKPKTEQAKPTPKPQAQKPKPAPKVERPKDHVKAVKYENISDDDFFGRFNNYGIEETPKPKKAEVKPQEDEPLTLDDIFGKRK